MKFPLRPLTRCLSPLAVLLCLPVCVLEAAWDLKTLESVEAKVSAVAEKAASCVVALTHGSKAGIASGSGVIIGKNGLILTAAHVLADAQIVNVTFADGKVTKAKVLGADYTRDVALALIIEAGEYPFAQLGDARDLKPGELVVALGHPGGFDLKRKAPVRFGRVFDGNDMGMIRTDCTLTGGDSGGALLDLDGKVVGVHHAVGPLMTANLDAPVSAVRKAWDRMITGERWGKRPVTTAANLPESELHGLQLDEFRALVLTEAMKSQGKISAQPATIAKWLKDCGMNADHVDSLEPMALMALLNKALDGKMKVAPGLRSASGAPVPNLSDEELSGLDLKKFQQQLSEDGLKNGGTLALDAGKLVERLQAAGMSAEKLQSMSSEQVIAFIKKVMDGGMSVQTQPSSQPGLDLEKLRQGILAEAMKNNGKVVGSPGFFTKLLTESGMKEDKARSLAPAKVAELIKQALGASGAVLAGNPAFSAAPEIVEQDKEILETMTPSFLKVAPSIVSLLDGDKPVAMGTVVRENGFILTKHSEIAQPKGQLKVKTADGREFPAVEVRSFADHDLALVKVSADHLAAVEFPVRDEVLRPGKFLFTPGNEAASPMTAMGVVSTLTRSLKESGGYLGLALKQEGKRVEIGGALPGGPGAKAGLQSADVILAIDDKAVENVDEMVSRIRKLAPDTKVQVKYRRGDEEKTTEITLGDRAKAVKPREHGFSTQKLGTEVSDHRNGFPLIFQHDQPLSPEQCGSIVIDLHGEVAGVNVARDSRIGTYAIPAKTVAELLQGVDFAALEQ